MSKKQEKKMSPGTPELTNTGEVLSLSTDEFLTRMGTSTAGLSPEEAAQRR